MHGGAWMCLTGISGGRKMQDMPYFMTNDAWFYFDGKHFVLTEAAPEKAKESLEAFYAAEEAMGYA